MSVIVTRVSAADLPCEVWTFPAPDATHPAPGNVSVSGADCASAVFSVAGLASEARVAVTFERRWLPGASVYGETL